MSQDKRAGGTDPVDSQRSCLDFPADRTSLVVTIFTFNGLTGKVTNVIHFIYY